MPNTPLILIPGIMGSMLRVLPDNAPDTTIEGGLGYRAWVNMGTPDDFGGLKGDYEPSSQKVNCIAAGMRVVPEGSHLRGGLYPMDNLNPEFVIPFRPPPAELQYFTSMIRFLVQNGYYAVGTTLFGFGYVWIQSNPMQCNLLKRKILDVLQQTGASKVDILSHSMGGLVTKSAMAQDPDFFSTNVRKWIAVGAPFRGSPALAADGLLTGVDLRKGFITNLTMPANNLILDVSLHAPALHELVGSNTFQWPDGSKPTISIYLRPIDNQPTDLVTYPISRLKEVMALAHANRNYTGYIPNRPRTTSSVVWERVDRTQQLLDGAKLPLGVRFYNAYGTDFLTPFSVTYGTERAPLGWFTDIERLNNGVFSYIDGDGTVPAASGAADGFIAEARLPFAANHRGLIDSVVVQRQCLDWLLDFWRIL
jgi:phospholipase A1